ncbi:MAG: hypothetical protein AB7P99_18835 [Vicinamibacterales bacterium]
MPVTSERTVPVAALLALLLGAACGGGDPSSRSPTAPSATGSAGGTSSTAGTWTGTLTRPGGLGTLSARWEAAINRNNLEGPLTLTNGEASVTVMARGSTGGNDREGYGISMSFNQEPGELPTTGCAVLAGPVGGGDGRNFPAPYNRFTFNGLDISYSGCRGGLISTGYSDPQTNFLREVVSLEMSK